VIPSSSWTFSIQYEFQNSTMTTRVEKFASTALTSLKIKVKNLN
jgi:hypothetical protein